MKKFLLILISVFVASNALLAQDSIPENAGKVRFGAFASLNLSEPLIDEVNVELYSMGAGVGVGGFAVIPLGKKGWFFEPALELYYDTWSIREDMLGDIIEEVNIPAGASVGVKYDNFGIAVPLELGYYFSSVGLSIATGPMFRYGFSGNETLKVKYGKSTITDSVPLYNRDTPCKRGEVDLRLSIMYNLMDMLFFGFSWDLGLTNIAPDSFGNKIYTNNTNFKVGYVF